MLYSAVLRCSVATHQAEIAASLTTCTDATACANLKIMQNAPSAFWVDTQSKIFGDNSSSNSVAAVLADAASRSPAPLRLVVFIVYDLPNRDCAAHSSNGELCCAYNADRTCDYGASGDCNDGIAEYQTKYVNALVSLFARYHTQVPIVAIVEPDSLPNLATNQGNPHCGNVATNAAYKTGVAYAVQQIAALAPSVAIYKSKRSVGMHYAPGSTVPHRTEAGRARIPRAKQGCTRHEEPCSPTPLLQVECHAYLQQEAMLEHAQKAG
jgi:cellulase/cellobiase CelA1